MKIYLANGLFSEADLRYNDYLADEIEMLGHTVYAPQRNTAINDKTKAANSVAIYEGDTEKLKWCDIVVAVIDGPVVDAGVASEIGWIAGYNEKLGYAECMASQYGDGIVPKKQILGLFTDSRDGSKTYLEAKNEMLRDDVAESQYPYVNLYTVGAIKKWGKVFKSSKELLEYIGGLPR